MGLCEEAGPQEAVEFACGLGASLGCAVDLPSGRFLGAVFILSGSLFSGAVDQKRAIGPGFIMHLIRNQTSSRRPSALTAWLDTGLSQGRL